MTAYLHPLGIFKTNIKNVIIIIYILISYVNIYNTNNNNITNNNLNEFI